MHFGNFSGRADTTILVLEKKIRFYERSKVNLNSKDRVRSTVCGCIRKHRLERRHLTQRKRMWIE